MLTYFSCGQYGCDCYTPHGPRSFSSVNVISMHRLDEELAHECGHYCQRQDKCSLKAKGKKIWMDFLPISRPARTKWLVTENDIPSCQHFLSSCQHGGSRARHQHIARLRLKELVSAGTELMGLQLLQHNLYFRVELPPPSLCNRARTPPGFPWSLGDHVHVKDKSSAPRENSTSQHACTIGRHSVFNWSTVGVWNSTKMQISSMTPLSDPALLILHPSSCPFHSLH